MFLLVVLTRITDAWSTFGITVMFLWFLLAKYDVQLIQSALNLVVCFWYLAQDSHSGINKNKDKYLFVTY